MACFGGVDEERRCAGRGKGRRDLAADMTRLAKSGDDQSPLGVADQVGGRGKRAGEIGLQCRHDRGDAASFRVQRAQRREDGGVSVIGAG